MEITEPKQEKSLKQSPADSDADVVNSEENLTNSDPVQATELEETSFVRLARKARKLSYQFGWPMLALILIGPASTGRTPTAETFPIFLKIGIFPILAGLFLRLWARGYRRDEGFVLDGPYRYVRNPVELGALLVFGGGAVLAGLNAWYIAVILLCAIAYLSAVAASYESDILRRVGAPFLRYRRRVGRWIPNWHPGTNRTQRTHSTLQALVVEKESLLWVIGYLVVFAVRHRVPAVTEVFR